jgi:molybdopterin-guanine dinucleotide biosynthesis protein A
MGRDKATIEIDGVPLADRIVSRLASLSIPMTVLGPRAIEGAEWLEDSELYRGPLVALSRFRPKAEAIFVCSCDLVNLDPGIVSILQRDMRQAAVPFVGGSAQPLCAVYRRDSFDLLPNLVESGVRSMMGWLDRLDLRQIDEAELVENGISPKSVLGVNTEEELAAAVTSSSRTV